MFASYLIGLREGLEATLVVSILVAFLVKSDRRDKLPLVWTGVAAAVALSVGFGALLSFTAAHLAFEQQELFEAVASIAATVFVTWMIFWMRGAARRISADLRAKLGEALEVGSVAVAVMAFLAVVREGLETSLLFFASAQGAAATATPLIGITLGLLTSIVIGWGLYASAIRVNLTKFFTWTGILLILVAGGILKYGVHDLQEAGILPGLNTLAFDISAVLDPSAWYSALLSGMFNITAAPSVLETIAWTAYVLPVMFLFLRPAAPAKVAAPAS
ncbi:iron transporter [Acrocarpospora phusangensis]|uniref:Iron transporter n=1 Tax=Acrocarpospora phusangensis TaxID=1070424 RepID=A0A919UJ75_9ACTN|nr:iron uptake transporter permease EfeU [Acrocarpospora phusangensis]GIH23794.1 iron transporter [Acrocarpospora phusangensis]